MCNGYLRGRNYELHKTESVMKTSKIALFFLVFVIFLLLLGCGTRKSVKKEQKETHMESVDSIHFELSHRDSFEWSKLESSYTNMRITITDLSPPDSLGKQHPTKKTEITIDNTKEINENASAGSQLEQDSVKANKNKQDEKSVVETKKDIDTRLIPVWAWWVLLVGSVIVAIFTWLVKRK